MWQKAYDKLDWTAQYTPRCWCCPCWPVGDLPEGPNSGGICWNLIKTVTIIWKVSSSHFSYENLIFLHQGDFARDGGVGSGGDGGELLTEVVGYLFSLLTFEFEGWIKSQPPFSSLWFEIWVQEQHRELSSVQSQLLLQDATLLLKIWLTERVAFNHPHQNNKMTFQVSTKNLSTGW